MYLLDLFWVFSDRVGGFLSLFGLVDVYSKDGRILLVTSEHIFLSGFCFRFRLASLSVFCCWVSSSS